jgi:hypothetical protein
MRGILLLVLTASLAHAQQPSVQRFLIPVKVEEERQALVWEAYTVERKEPRVVYHRVTQAVKRLELVYVPYDVEREEERVVYRRHVTRVARPVLLVRQEEALVPSVVYREAGREASYPHPVLVPRDVEVSTPRLVYREVRAEADVHVTETLPVIEKGAVTRWSTRQWGEVRQLRELAPRWEVTREKAREYALELRLLPGDRVYEARLELLRQPQTTYRLEVREVEEVEYLPRVERVKLREKEYRPEWRAVEREEVSYVPRAELVPVCETHYRLVPRKVRDAGVVHGERVEVTIPRPPGRTSPPR